MLGGHTYRTPKMLASSSTAVSTSLGDSLEYQSVSLVAVGGDNRDSTYKAFEITLNNTIIKSRDGHRLHNVLLSKARKSNPLRSDERGYEILPNPSSSRHRVGESPHPVTSPAEDKSGRTGAEGSRTSGAEMGIEGAPTSTHPLFPPLPVYGPPTPLRRIKTLLFRATSSVLSLTFLSAIVVGSVMKSLPAFASDTLKRIKGVDPDASRPFNRIEKERAKERKAEEADWEARQGGSSSADGEDIEIGGKDTRNRQPTGGKDKLVCNIGYYARRVGLEVEEFKVETEDGFLIDLQHVFDPDDSPYYPDEGSEADSSTRRKKYPVLLMHGLLQNAGAFCVNDDESLAFYLCKRSGLPYADASD